MDPGDEKTAADDFDPRSLAALERELAQRVESRHRDFSVASWEFDSAARARSTGRAGFGAWLFRGGVAAALVGAVAGAFALPQLAQREAARPMRAAVARAPVAQAEPEVSPVIAPPPLPPLEAPAQPSPRVAADTPVDPQPREIPAAKLPQPPLARITPPEPDEEPSDAVATLAPPSAAPVPRPSFDCADILNLADELVCNDAGLAAQDRELGRALRQARDAGVPVERLRRQQARWGRAREQAAHAAPWRLPTVYDRRIEELRAETEALEAAQAAEAEGAYEP